MLLNVEDHLPRRPLRVLVAGAPGAGKSTLAARIAGVLSVPYVQLDGLFHGPGWTPRADFEADVQAFSAGPAWVTEWQYGVVRPLLMARADLLVWLDLSRPVVLRRVVARTLRRRLRRQVLWNGNTEPPLRTIFTDREHIIRWAWSTHHDTAQRVAQVPQLRPELVVVRLRERDDADRWVSGPLRRAAQSPETW